MVFFQINAWLDEVAANSSNAKVVVGGSTYEGRSIRGLEITNGANLPGVILESGIHAREWIGPAATTWIVDKIVNSAEGSIWRKFNYIYFPSVNPDGYVYTHEQVPNIAVSRRGDRETSSPLSPRLPQFESCIFPGFILCYFLTHCKISRTACGEKLVHLIRSAFSNATEQIPTEITDTTGTVNPTRL